MNEEVLTFNKTVLNILSNFIPHKLIVCHDKNPSWFNNKIKTLIHEKNQNIQSPPQKHWE